MRFSFPTSVVGSIALLFASFSCRSQEASKGEIVNVIGEIFQEDGDDPNFKTCGSQKSIVQYYAFNEKPIKGEKAFVIEQFEKKYKPISKAGESGLIRIRFVVNCAGKAGRFRTMGMNEKYEAKVFSAQITDQLMKITKNLNCWKVMKGETRAHDYYMYLIFKIKDGRIIEILP